ncbi:hypothetical protein HPB51_014191 [Rhipicephalus microplus]|uniref:Uncharacterized protein n=1 Tax=Rhipicephalus microplus TaxID=6941 RepID=A0A9J6E1Q6_RHIMP|nr:hypothetical protein HPB51_014191 [Rhipicephalus microplus]
MQADTSANDPDLNNRLESLCLSVTEHALGGSELGEVDNIDEWSAKLLAATEGATEEIDAPKEIETMDTRLAHLLEARRSLQKRWRRQRHNRKLRKIAELAERSSDTAVSSAHSSGLHSAARLMGSFTAAALGNSSGN